MNTKQIHSAVLLAMAAGMSSNAHAMLDQHAVLNFTSTTLMCLAGSTGIPPNCINQYGSSSTGIAPATGSYYAMDIAGNGTFSTYERRAITANEGIQIGDVQRAYGSHTGLPDGTETPSIDMPFDFFGHTGMHQTTSPVTILSDDGAGHVTLNFSGWALAWAGLDMPLGGSFSSDTGIATVTCTVDCSNGDMFTLNYTAHVPYGDPSNFGGVYYGLHLVGVVSSVPVPSAVWLFGTGLIGLAGVAQRRRIA